MRTISSFNPRARVGRDATMALSLIVLDRFNPRARVGRDSSIRKLHEIVIVSIHAPAWGATIRILAKAVDGVVSIHAPAWGATISMRYHR